MSGFNLPEHTQTPNELFDSMMATMSDAELRIVLVCVRKMFGWHKAIEAISLTQFEQLTGLSRSGVRKGIKEALEHGHIKIVGKGKRGVHQYQLAIREEEPTMLPGDIVPVHVVAQSQGSSTKESSKEKEHAPEGALPEKPLIEKKKEKPRNALYDAILTIWGYTASRNKKLAKMLQGVSTDKGYVEFNVIPGITAEELLKWRDWYFRRYAGRRIVEELIKVQSSIGEYRHSRQTNDIPVLDYIPVFPEELPVVSFSKGNGL